jgi:hypothetical protein
MIGVEACKNELESKKVLTAIALEIKYNQWLIEDFSQYITAEITQATHNQIGETVEINLIERLPEWKTFLWTKEMGGVVRLFGKSNFIEIYKFYQHLDHISKTSKEIKVLRWVVGSKNQSEVDTNLLYLISQGPIITHN